MSLVRLNGRTVSWGELRIPRVGAWEGDFGVERRDGDTEITGTAHLEIGSRSWGGTVWRSGENQGLIYVRVVGGQGGLSSVVGPRAYQGVPLSLPLDDLLREIGEQLSATADAASLGLVVQKWNRATGPAGVALANLVAAAGRTWRVLSDGTIWIGAETWPACPMTTADYVHLAQAPNTATLDIVATDPRVLPGQVFEGRRVSVVTHRWSGQDIRTRILWEEEQSETDRMKAGLRGVVKAAIPHLDFLAGYRCRVVAQNADGSLELQPDDARIPSLSNVPVRYGVPGCSATVPADCRVLLEFAGGDPSLPYASVWETTAPTQIVVGTGTNQPAALATALRTELDALWSALQTHVHPGVSTGGGSTGAPTVVKSAETIASAQVRVGV